MSLSSDIVGRYQSQKLAKSMLSARAHLLRVGALEADRLETESQIYSNNVTLAKLLNFLIHFKLFI